jgi:Helix-turn-helix domain
VNLILNAAWRVRVERPSHRLVLVRLADQARADGLAWPSIESLSTLTLLSKRTVIRAIEALEEGGYLQVLPRHKNEDGSRNNCYRICLEKLGVSGAKMSLQSAPAGDTLSLREVTNGTVRGDMVSKPPAPPYRKNHQEPTHEPGEEVIGEVVRRIAQAEPSLRADAVLQALVIASKVALGNGSSPEDVIRQLPARWKKFSAARDQGKFEIRGWGAANFFAGGHWREEQGWPWKPEFRPEPKMRYVDPAMLYSGPEYQRRAVGA